MSKKIYLSPANHNGENKCKYSSACRETIHSFATANWAKRYLAANGFSVKVRQTMKNGKILGSRTMALAVAEANKWGADIYIPIHSNASSDKDTSGLMFMTLNKTADRYKNAYNKIGKTIQADYAAYLKSVGKTANSAKWVARSDLYEINEPNALTFYLEMGYHTNKATDVLFIHHKDGETAGKAIAKGICKYYGVTFKGIETEPIADVTPEAPESPEIEEKPKDEQVIVDDKKTPTEPMASTGNGGLIAIIVGILLTVLALIF